MARLQYGRFALPCVLIAAGFFLFLNLGSLPLADPDEPRYGESAREMVEQGSVMVPLFNYAPRLEKPVLYYWTICLGYLLLGVSEFSARLSSALAVICAFFVFLRRYAGAGAAVLSCAMLCSCPLFFVPARLSMPDMLLGLFVTCALLCFYAGWQEADARKKYRWYAGFYALQVLGAWTKGPVGILLPMGVALAALARERDLKELRSLRPVPALCMVVLASLPWYLYVYLNVDPDTMLRLSETETAGYLFGAGQPVEPLWFYFAVACLGLFPWTFLLPWALLVRRRQSGPARLRNFFETWFAAVFMFFTACLSKKPHYIITVACAFAGWLGVIAAECSNRRAQGRDAAFLGGLGVAAAAVLAGCGAGLWWIAQSRSGQGPAGCALLLATAAPACAALWLAAHGNNRPALTAMSLAVLLSIAPITTLGSPWISRHRSTRAIVGEYASLIGRADAVYCGTKILNSLVYYLRRPVVIETDQATLLGKLQSPRPCVGFLTKKKYAQSRGMFSGYAVAERDGKVLLSNMPETARR